MTTSSRIIHKAIFPVAGLGTRFLPATKAIPKEMLPIMDKPLIQYAVEEAIEAGIDEFIFVTSRGKVAIANHFDYMPELEEALFQKNKTTLLEAVKNSTIPAGKMFFTSQNKALGLGHAIWCAKNLIKDEPFAVLLPDDIYFGEPNCLKELVDAYSEDPQGYMVAVEDVEREQTNRYGILDIKEDFGSIVTATSLVEKPSPQQAPSNVAITGRYILDPAIFAALDKQIIGSGGEIQLTDAITATLSDTIFKGLRFTGKHFDCGSQKGWLKANLYKAINSPDTSSFVTDYLAEQGFIKG